MKNFSYTIFHLIYGKVVINKNPQQENSNIVVNTVEMNDANDAREYKIYKVKNGRLYTDRVHSVAVIEKNYLIEEPSFQISGKNFSKKENFVLKIGTPRFLKKINGKVLSLLAGGGSNLHYWHWLFDVLPRIKIYSLFFNIDHLDYLLVPNYSENFQQETLDLLNFENKKILSSVTYRHIKPTELYVTQHPYLLNDFDKDELNIPTWIINWLRMKFLRRDSFSNIDLPKKIYIDRSDSRYKTRTIINEEEVKNFLEKKDFQPLQLSKYSFIDQVKLFNNAESIVGLHGGGFANIIFCKPDTNILEFRTNRTGKVIENLGIKNKLNFKKIECIPKNVEATYQQGCIHIDMKKLEKKIENEQ